MITEPAGGGKLETALRRRRDSGGKCLVPYVTGGLGDDWLQTISAAAAAGADAVEVGVPFSDPVMDGATIQRANEEALAQGATPQSILSALRGAAAEIGVPVAVMTYANIAHHMGYERFASSLADAGVSGCILADLPLEEVGEWAGHACAAGVETVLLASPTASCERLRLVCERSRGFVYGVGLLGVTGVRSQLADSATRAAARLKEMTDRPVLVGVGVGTPEQAAAVCRVADGAVVGSAVVQRMLEGAGPAGVAVLVSAFRAALD
ncbi:MAG: tryptophan synthase subunit alpha [Acidimicrobiaceae bacterium]|nr:tryptophan synthase subunit alpha [Acidimicrobiaceae bacterium]